MHQLSSLLMHALPPLLHVITSEASSVFIHTPHTTRPAKPAANKHATPARADPPLSPSPKLIFSIYPSICTKHPLLQGHASLTGHEGRRSASVMERLPCQRVSVGDGNKMVAGFEHRVDETHARTADGLRQD